MITRWLDKDKLKLSQLLVTRVWHMISTQVTHTPITILKKRHIYTKKLENLLLYTLQALKQFLFAVKVLFKRSLPI